MAGGMRRFMEYLGLVDADYDDEYGYDEPGPVATRPQAVGRQTGTVRSAPPEDAGQVRTLRPVPSGEPAGDATSGVTPIAKQTRVREVPATKDPKVGFVEPQEYADVKQIGDLMKAGNPVVVSIVDTDVAVGRRITDFCAGCAYVVSGKMDRVARSVFLLVPGGVEVSESDKRKLLDRGYKLPEA